MADSTDRSSPPSPDRWRLIFDAPDTVLTDGALNMARDEAILTVVGSGQEPPTLRLYGWQPACLSLGHGQHIADADEARLAARGWSLVRRLSGGRAILHIDELTYSLSLPAGHPLAAGSVVDSYQRISVALFKAMERLGAASETARRDLTKRAEIKAVCFESPSDYEITANGKKLVGSAQVRPARGILQHGTIPLSGDIARICDGLHFTDEAAREQARQSVQARAITLSDAVGHSVTWEEAAAALRAAFADVFKVRLIPGDITETEWALTEKLRVERYDTKEWTHRR
jgi:lipoate-protein ligase A